MDPIRMRREMKVKRRELKKKKKRVRRVLCDFCGSSSKRYEHTQEADDEALLIESELKRLRLLTRRMSGKDLDGLAFAELVLLETLLKQVLLIVKKLKKKTELEEEERLRNHKKKAGDDEGEGSRARREVVVLAPCNSNSSGERQEDGAPPPLSQTQIEYERRRTSESIQSEFERLWLLKERMNGRELEGMTSSELGLLVDEIHRGLDGLHDQMFGPRMEQIASHQKEKLITQLKDAQERLGTR